MKEKTASTPKNFDYWFSLITLGFTVPILVMLLVFFRLRSEGSQTLTPISITTGEWSPYSGEDLKEYGVASAIVTEVLKKIGYQSKFQFLPWEQAEEAARLGQTNQQIRATFPWRKTEERERSFYYSDPIIKISLSAFYHAERTPELKKIPNSSQLSNQQLPYKFLAIKSYSYPKEIDRQKLDTIPAEDNIDAFRQLLTNPQIKLVLESTEVGQEILRKHFSLQQAKIRTTPELYVNELHLLASRRNPHNRKFINQFNQALRQMRDDGSLASLEAEITAKIDAMRMVQLLPFTSDSYLNGYLKPDGQQPILLPRGTQAVVEAWSLPYLTSYDSSAQSREDFGKKNLIKVRILNGPLSQKVLYVDGRNIYLSK